MKWPERIAISTSLAIFLKEIQRTRIYICTKCLGSYACMLKLLVQALFGGVKKHIDSMLVLSKISNIGPMTQIWSIFPMDSRQL